LAPFRPIAPGARAAGRRRPWWASLPDEALLDVPLAKLGLAIAGSRLEPLLARLGRELERAGIRRFRPYAWLSTGWFTPHGMTGFAIPFYAAHPRLVALERRMIGYAEGGDAAGCMRILRHEAGHALDNAYRLHRRASWRAHFGAFGEPYRSTYRPRGDRAAFVENIGHGYATSHPCEDWAETFAVWLAPGSRWRTRYAGLPVLRKLCYVDELVHEIRDLAPAVHTRERVDPLAEQHATLREYYARKSTKLGRARLRGEFLR
jgi:hypothetical protein